MTLLLQFTHVYMLTTQETFIVLERSPLSESSCWQHSGTPKGLHANNNVERYHCNKCKLLWHAKKWTGTGYLHKTERKVVTECCFVTQQYMPPSGTPHHQHHSNTELGSSRVLCPQCRSGAFRFPPVWNHQECSKRSLICGWLWGEKSTVWVASQSTKKFFSRH